VHLEDSPATTMLLGAQEFCATIGVADMDKLEAQLEASNAFKEHDESRLKF
jgi:hypothetical protein